MQDKRVETETTKEEEDDYDEVLNILVRSIADNYDIKSDGTHTHFDIDYAMGWEDISFNSGPLITLDMWEKVVVPRYKRISSKLRSHGIDIYIVDTDGKIDELEGSE